MYTAMKMTRIPITARAERKCLIATNIQDFFRKIISSLKGSDLDLESFERLESRHIRAKHQRFY